MDTDTDSHGPGTANLYQLFRFWMHQPVSAPVKYLPQCTFTAFGIYNYMTSSVLTSETLSLYSIADLCPSMNRFAFVHTKLLHGDLQSFRYFQYNSSCVFYRNVQGNVPGVVYKYTPSRIDSWSSLYITSTSENSWSSNILPRILTIGSMIVHNRRARHNM